MTSWWRAPSIRLRLSVWYAVALSLLLVVYAATTFVSVRREFFEQLDDELQEDFSSAPRLLSLGTDRRIVWAGDRRRDPETAIDVWSLGGEPLYRSSTSAALAPPVVTAAGAAPRYESVVAKGVPWRALTGTSVVGGTAVIVRVSRSEARLREQLSEIAIVLALGLPVVAALAGLVGYFLARRALAPIDRIASEARRITADRLHERLSPGNPGDEIGRLAAVVNETFGRLEASFGQLRRFTADASHELRTPLAVIRGTGEVALGNAGSVVDCKDAIGSMLEEVDRLTGLVDTLLRLSHGDAGTLRLSPQATDLGALVREVTTSLAILAEERGQKLVLHDDPVEAVVDRLVLREAISNVLDNAVKYSPDHTTIDVRVRARDGHGVIEIVDQGSGVPVEHRERIFDRFYRVDQARSRESGGTGLGLAIAKWAVEANGGRIEVDASPGGGAVFRITLPLRISAEAIQRAGGASQAGRGGT